jgi:hypothetical protein
MAENTGPGDTAPVTEQERESLLQALLRHVAEGRLELEEFDARAARLYRAGNRGEARAALDGLPLLAAPTAPGRRARRRHGEGEPVQPHWVATGEVFRDPTSGRVMRVWVDPTDGARHYAPAEQ